jgi:hypothetical protein
VERLATRLSVQRLPTRTLRVSHEDDSVRLTQRFPKPCVGGSIPPGGTAGCRASLDPGRFVVARSWTELRGMTVENIAEKYIVTVEMARFRVNTTGVVRQLRRRKAL